MKFSVIIPVYNAGKYLSDCLDSVLNQKFDGETEIIAVDDGSGDGSLELLKKYAAKDSRIQVFSQHRQGQSVARNFALGKATGDYLIFVDADDELLPGSLNLFAEAIARHGADIAVGEISLKNISRIKDISESFKHIDSNEAVAITFYRKPFLFWGSVCAKAFKKDLFTNLRFPEGIIYEDLYIMPRLFLAASNIWYTKNCVYYYRHNPQSSITTWSDKRKEIFGVIDGLGKLPDIQNNRSLVNALGDRELNAAFQLYLLSKINEKDNREFRSLCKEKIRSHRLRAIFNPRSRFKSRVASVESYLGMWLPELLNKIFKFVR